MNYERPVKFAIVRVMRYIRLNHMTVINMRSLINDVFDNETRPCSVALVHVCTRKLKPY